MDIEPNEVAERAQTLFQWHNLIVATCKHSDALELWLHDDRNELLDPYCRASLARICQSIHQGLAFWRSGDTEHGGSDEAAAMFTQAGTTAMELYEILEELEQPLLALLRLGMESIYAVGRDIEATIVNEDPF